VRALLIYLATTTARDPLPQSRDVLAELLWADSATTSRLNLRKALSNLRQLIGSTLREDANLSIWLDPAHCWSDVAEFERRAAAVGADVVALQGAVALYRDDFLKGFNLSLSYEFEAWALAEQTRLKLLLVDLLSRLSVAQQQRNNLPQAILTSRRLLDLEP
jgi:DNA-binding SARP family transcriptional activator